MTIAAILGSKGREVISVTAGHSVSEAVTLLATRRIGAVPVLDGDNWSLKDNFTWYRFNNKVQLVTAKLFRKSL